MGRAAATAIRAIMVMGVMAFALAPLADPVSAATAPPPVFGIFPQNVPGQRLSTNDRIGLAQSLHVGAIRTTVSNADFSPATARQYIEIGLNVVLTIVNDPELSAGNPSVPVTDLAPYRRQLQQVFDAFPTGVPVVAIENEPEAPKFFSGTADQYLAELQAATTVAHANGIKVTNGGLTGIPAAFLTWLDLWNSGDHAAADAFVQEMNGVGRPGGNQLLAQLPTSADPTRPIPSSSQIDFAKQTVEAYATMDIDYVNLHWYQAGTSTAGLERVIAYLGRVTGKPVMSNEFGQLDDEPSTVTAELAAVSDAGFPYAIWFSGDKGKGAMALQNADNTLKPNGLAFREFMDSHHQATPAAVIRNKSRDWLAWEPAIGRRAALRTATRAHVTSVAR
ncbi:MAG: hypothetical protein QM589_15985 [Thermomicrobiales bacterium]